MLYFIYFQKTYHSSLVQVYQEMPNTTTQLYTIKKSMRGQTMQQLCDHSYCRLMHNCSRTLLPSALQWCLFSLQVKNTFKNQLREHACDVACTPSSPATLTAPLSLWWGRYNLRNSSSSFSGLHGLSTRLFTPRLGCTLAVNTPHCRLGSAGPGRAAPPGLP